MKTLAAVGSAFFISASAYAGTFEYPAVKHVYEAVFNDRAFRLEFDADGKTMRFAKAEEKDFEAVAESVSYTAVAIRPGVFMVYWTEHTGTTVVHVEDFEHEIVYTNITKPDLKFFNLSGSWKRLK
ncbi:MAG TPA: hypothetical protein VIF60_20705 [Burkholderiaceae bacterium]|jgi:hypothetical protein